MAIKVLQADNSIEHQRQLVAEALPELESFIIIGKRPTASEPVHLGQSKKYHVFVIFSSKNLVVSRKRYTFVVLNQTRYLT